MIDELYPLFTLNFFPFSGSADKADKYFSDSASNRVILQHQSESNSNDLQICNEDFNKEVPKIISGARDTSSKQPKQLNSNNLKEITCHSHGVNLNSNLSAYNTPSPTPMQVGFYFKILNYLQL